MDRFGGGWAVYVQDRISDLIAVLERLAEAAERIAAASEEAVEEEEPRK